MVSLDRAGRLCVETLRVLRRGDIAGAPERLVVGGRELIFARDDPDLFVAVDRRSHTVARAVDVDDLARLGDAVGGEQIMLAARRLRAQRGGVPALRQMPMAEHRVVPAEQGIQPQLLERDAAAEADGRTVDLRVEVFGGLLCRLKARDLKAARGQRLCHIRKVHDIASFLFLTPSARRRGRAVYLYSPSGLYSPKPSPSTSRASQTMKKAVGSISFTSRLTATISRRRTAQSSTGLSLCV